MQVNIQGHGIELTAPLRDYAEKRINKLLEFDKNIIKAQVVLDARCHDDSKRTQVAEVTLWVTGKKVIRATEAGEDMYAAIDLVLAEIEGQVKKHKEKQVEEVRRTGEKIKQLTRTYVPSMPQTDGPKLAKLKRFDITVMTKDEAKTEQKNLGHDFFIFRDAQTGNINVLHNNEVIGPNSLSKLSEDEAVSRFVGKGDLFFAFFNKDSNNLNVLYKRKSGNLGLIQPSA